MARKNDGVCANPKQIRTDVDCRAARPKFDNGAWSPAKISDVTVSISSSRRTRAGPATLPPSSGGWATASTAARKPTPSALTATARMARSRSQTRGASATRPKTCSRKVKTRAPRSSSTSTGKRPPGPSSNGPTSGSRRRRWRKSNAAGSSRCATPRPSRCSSCASATSRIASASCTGRTSSVRTCSLSCVHTKPRESWKPATACAASVSKSATMPMSKATATIHSAT
jgi:hypothetical protein